MSKISKYMPEIIQFQTATKGHAVYCFVIDGNKGTGGMPLISMPKDHVTYVSYQRELIRMMRRSAGLMELNFKDKGIVG